MGCVVGKNAGHIFHTTLGFSAFEGLHDCGILFPRLPPIERSSHEDPVSPGPMRPIRSAAELIEMEGRQVDVPFVVKSSRDVSPTLPTGHRRKLREGKSLAAVRGVGN